MVSIKTICCIFLIYSPQAFVTKSYDATTHFESTCEDVVEVYERVTGKPFDFSAVQSQIETGAAAAAVGGVVLPPLAQLCTVDSLNSPG